jgi:hypothetical protein
MCDPRAGAGLPALQLPDRGARCGSRWANLLLRSLRAYGRRNNVEGPRLTGKLFQTAAMAAECLVCERGRAIPTGNARFGAGINNTGYSTKRRSSLPLTT